MKLLLAALLLAVTLPCAAAGESKLEPCQYGIMLAQKAYLTGTFDAQRYDTERLAYLINYWGDVMIVKVDREVAYRAVMYMARRLKDAGIRRPSEALLYEPSVEIYAKECGKYAM